MSTILVYQYCDRQVQEIPFSLSISILSRSFIYTSYYRRRFYGKLNNTTDWLLKLYFHQFLWRWRVEKFKDLSHAQGPTGNVRSSFKITWASGYKTGIGIRNWVCKWGTTKQSPVESGGLILVYMYIKWCIPVVLVVFFYIFLIISNKINTK